MLYLIDRETESSIFTAIEIGAFSRATIFFDRTGSKV